MTTAKAERAGAVCDGCGAPDTEEKPLMGWKSRVDGWPVVLWLCRECFQERVREKLGIDVEKVQS